MKSQWLRRVLFGVQPAPEQAPPSLNPIWDELSAKLGTPAEIWSTAA